MSGPSMHRAMCKKVACLECDSLETGGPETTSMTERLTTFITRQFIEDFERHLFYDSTMQSGRKIAGEPTANVDMDLDQLMVEMAEGMDD